MGHLPTPPKAGRITAKRDEEKIGHGHGKRDKPARVVIAEEVEYSPPDPAKEWSEPNKRWYESVKLSAYSILYEPSDWETVWMLCQWRHSLENSPRLSAYALSALITSMGDLMITEGSRRRAKIEIQRSSLEDFEEQQQEKRAGIRKRLSNGGVLQAV